MDDPQASHGRLARRGFLGLAGSTALALLAGTAAADDPSAAGDGLGGAADVAGGFDGLRLTELGRHESEIFNEGGAELVAYHAPTQRLFVINAALGGVDVLDVSDPTAPAKVADVDVAGELDGVDTANSVSTSSDLVAVAIGAENPQEPGRVGLYDPETLELLDTVTVGALPDKVTFTPDGTRALVADEGEPGSDYGDDPQGRSASSTSGAAPSRPRSPPRTSRSSSARRRNSASAASGSSARTRAPRRTSNRSTSP